MVNGGSEANFLALWSLLEPDDRLAFMVPNYMQGWGLGSFFGLGESDRVRLRMVDGRRCLGRPAARRGHEAHAAVMTCNPNNPTGHVLTDDEMDEVVRAADRVGAWIVADEIYRGAELDTDDATPTFFGRYERVIVTSGLSKAFAMPGLRVGWAVAPARDDRAHLETSRLHDLAPSAISDRLAAFAMLPEVREAIRRAPVRSSGPTTRGSEAWLETHRDIFTWERPHAGAIAYARWTCRSRASTRRALPHGAERAARARRHVRIEEGPAVRIRLRHRAHAEGLSLVDEVLADVAVDR